jgi:phenylacetate-CoA ligase
MLSNARALAARMMPRGASPEIAEEVRRTLASTRTRASEDDIARIVEHATTTVPFYREFADTPFHRLPVVSKPLMVADPQSFIAEGVAPEKLTTRLTSGSSGLKFRSYFDDERIARHRAELVGSYRYLRADPFGTFLHCREWYQVTARERLDYSLRGQKLYAAEQDAPTVRGVARWLGRRRGTVIIGLCTYIEVLLERFDELGISFPPGTVSVIVGAGEPATSRLAEMTRRQFGVDLRMRYSNTENGILGFMPEGASSFRTYKLNTTAFHVEILSLDSDEPAPAGEVGRIVVTDLHNRAMPFLRWDTGDLGRFEIDEDGEPMPDSLAELTGRARDFPLAGTEARPRRSTHFKILEPVEAIPSLTQFQLRQHAIGRFTWILNAEGTADLETELRRILDEQIGDIISCDFVYSESPVHGGTGKRQSFVSEIPDPEALLRSARGRGRRAKVL